MICVIFPSKSRVYLSTNGEDFRGPSDPLIASLRTRGYEVLDLTDVLREHAARGEQVYFETDGHPNALGNRIIADRAATIPPGDSPGARRPLRPAIQRLPLSAAPPSGFSKAQRKGHDGPGGIGAPGAREHCAAPATYTRHAVHSAVRISTTPSRASRPMRVVPMCDASVSAGRPLPGSRRPRSVSSSCCASRSWSRSMPRYTASSICQSSTSL